MPLTSRLGVCAWSLQPESLDDLLAACKRLQLRAVQLPLKAFHRRGMLRSGWSESGALAELRAAGIEVCSGMFATVGEDYSSLESIRATGGVRADAHWSANERLAAEDGARARRLGLNLVSFHPGFLPEDRTDPLREVMLHRLRSVIDSFSREGVDVAFETGQESAETLFAVLEDLQRPAVGVNFDPANMILYGQGDPVAACETLASRVKQLHVKDAIGAEHPGQWGREVVVGSGSVDWEALFGVLSRRGLAIDCLIEREAGDDREGDVARAARRVGPLVAALNEPAT
ncbi:MAG: L-ribulose-5-phosphate 3-epimerase [Pseudohongiellaceae bacterium]|jgi:L-ribulose-5-phosphate 3-epimerase